MVLAIDAILRPPMSEAEGGETRTSKHHFSDSREFDDLASAFTRLRPSPASESLSALRRLHHCPRDCPASIRRGAFHDFAHAASARLRAPQLESRLLELFAYIEGSTPPPPAAATVGRAVEDVPLPPLTAALGEQKLDMLIDLLKDLGGLELSAGVLAQIFWSALADSAATNLRSADLPSAARLLVFKLANAASRCSSGLKGFVRGLALKVCEVGVEGVARLCARMEPQGLWANVFQRKKFEGLRSEGLVRAMLEVIDKTDPPPNEAGRIYIVSAIEIVFGGKTSGFSEGQAIDAGSSEGWEIHARSCDSPQALEEVNRSDTRNLSNRQSGRPPSQPQGPNTIESAAILFLDTLPTFYHRLSLDSTSPSIRRRLAALDIAASELGCSLGSQARILATIRVFTAQLAGRRLSTFDDFFAAAERGVAAGLRGQPRLRAVARALDAENFHQGLAAAAAAADMVGLVRVFAAPARKMSDASLHGRLDALIVFFGLEERDDKMRFGELGMQEREAGVFDSAFAFFRKVEELRREVERPVEKSMRTLIDHPTKVTICDYQTSNLISEYSTRGIIGDYSLRSSDRRDSTRSFAIQNDRRESNRSCFTPTSREHSPPPISTNPEDLSHSPELSTIFEIRTALAKMRLAVEAREILRHLSSPDLSTPPDPTTSDFLSALKSTIYTSSKSKLHIFNAISLIFTLGIFQGIVLLIQFGKTFRFAGENGFETSMAGLLVVLFLAWMFSLKKAFFPWTETDIHAMVQCEINDLFKVNEQ